jgi:predicted O-methyltransferase YrrM
LNSYLDIAYSIVGWKDDPYTPEGYKRFSVAMDRFRKLMRHPWLSKLLEKRLLTIVDVGAGKGIGSVALGKVLQENGVKARVYMIDLREGALKTALKFASENNVEAETYVVNASEVHRVGIRDADLALLYGGILAHFNEWELVTLFSSTTSIINDGGILLLEEFDRDHMLYTRGYKDLLVEKREEDSITISVHKRYDPITGSYYRLFIDLLGHRTVEVPINFRSIAQIASMLWIFMHNVDMVYTGESLVYYILGIKPRRKIDTDDLSIVPEILKRGNFWET